MSNSRENAATVDRITTQQSDEEEASNFRRRTLSNGRFVCPRRYVLASLLLILLVIEETRHWSLSVSLFDAVFSDETKKMAEYPSIGSWTLDEINKFGRFIILGAVIMNALGGLLIYQFSSHKFLLVTVTACSILHALLPTALNHHSTAFLLFVLICQEALSAPYVVAVLSMWRDWAPPDERTCLVSISFFGIVFEAVTAIFALGLPSKDIKSISYYIGISGLIWALFWYNIVSNTPQSDPQITEKEYLYLERKIPSDYQEKTRIKDVPWKSILKCKQVRILCVVFCKLGFSIQTVQGNGVLFFIYLEYDTNPMVVFIPFIILFIVFFYASSFFMDFLLRRYENKALTIRKIFLCGGFFLQSVFSLASIGSPLVIRAALHIVACCCLACSIAGILRYPLDLSPRYVSIIAGFAFASSSLGTLALQEFSHLIVDAHSSQPEIPLSIFDSIFSLLTAVVFGVWGDTEEQAWSFLTSTQRRGHDYRSYPQPDDDYDVNLVPEAV